MEHLARARARVAAWLRLSGLAAWRALLDLVNSNDFTYASSIAYYALFSLFPLLLLAISLFGFLSADPDDKTRVLSFVLAYLPGQFSFIQDQLKALANPGKPFAIGLAGALLLVWTSLGVFSAIASAVDQAWGVERQRSYLKHKLVAFTMLLTAGALLMTALLLASAAKVARGTWFAGHLLWVPGLSWLRGLVARDAPTLLLIVVVGLIYYFVPNAKVRFRDVWAGAVVAGLAWRGAYEGFSWYVGDLHRYRNVHGQIGAVVAFLTWVYISAVIFLYGVEFTADFARLARGRPESAPAAPAPRT